jgi:malonyl CoA-acyl carrier protein transacylase
MLAVLGTGAEDIKDAADEHGLNLANHNAPGQLVLSGDAAALKAVGAVARERGLRVIALDVAGAFHSPAMEPAVPGFTAALAEVELHPAAITVFSASTGKPFEDVRVELAQALVRPVRWVATVEAMAAAGATRFLDVGPGKVVAGLARRIVRGAEVVTLQEVASAAV